LEMARQNGNLAQINLPAIMNSMNPGRVSGRETGGYFDIEKASLMGSQSNSGSYQDDEMKELIRMNYKMMELLNQRFEKPIKADVSLRGRNGIYEMMEEDKLLQNNINI